VFVRFVIIMLLFKTFLLSQTIGALLSSLRSKDDLSNYTKEESAGFISVFTREDLDRMKINSFGELLEKIPFLKNKLDAFGTTDPFYQPLQINSPSMVRLFINDREIVTPIFGSGLRFFGQSDIAYIDHIEVYHGIPSYKIAIEPSVVIIKIYTKTPSRENVKLLGSSLNQKGSSNTYWYTSDELENFSYFSYINYTNLNKKEYYNQNSTLSRDKNFFHLFSQVKSGNSTLDLQILKGKLRNFTGLSLEITPIDNDVRYDFFSTSYVYKQDELDLKFVLNYNYFKNILKERSTSPLGFIDGVPYNSIYTKMKEHLLDLKLIKEIKFSNISLLFGISNRLKRFDFKDYKLNGIDFSDSIKYNQENISSIFSETRYKLNEKNSLIASLSAQYYNESSDIKGKAIYGARLGHIYKDGDFMQKTFATYGSFFPANAILLVNELTYGGIYNLEPETAYGVYSKLIWNKNDLKYSILFGRTFSRKGIFRDENGLKNFSDTNIFDSISLEYSYKFLNEGRIDINFWAVAADYGLNFEDRYSNDYGASFSLYRKFGKLDTYNSLDYTYGRDKNPDGWNYSFTLNYEYSKDLTLYIKGINVLDKALSSDYIGYNPLNNKLTVIDDVQNVDREFWVGMEYKF